MAEGLRVITNSFTTGGAGLAANGSGDFRARHYRAAGIFDGTECEGLDRVHTFALAPVED